MYKDGFNLPSSCIDLSTYCHFEAVTTVYNININAPNCCTAAYKHLEHSPKIPKWRFETQDSPTHESTQSATIYYR